MKPRLPLHFAMLLTALVWLGPLPSAQAGSVELDPAASREAYLYLNEFRTTPIRSGRAIGLKLRGVKPRHTLRWNAVLASVAEARALDMARNNYFGHVNGAGEGVNIQIQRAGYPLPARAVGDRADNYYESIGAGSEGGRELIDDLIIDKGIPSLGHRKHLLGIDPPPPPGGAVWVTKNSLYDEVGIGFVRVRGGGTKYRTYAAVVIAKAARLGAAVSPPSSAAPSRELRLLLSAEPDPPGGQGPAEAPALGGPSEVLQPGGGAGQSTFDCSNFRGSTMPAGSPVTVSLHVLNSTGPLPERAWAQLGGRKAPVRDDGREPDQQAGDRIYTTTLQVGAPGKETLSLHSVIGSEENHCEAEIVALPKIDLDASLPAGPLPLGPGSVGGSDPVCSARGACCGRPVRLDLSRSRVSHPVNAELRLAGGLPSGVSVYVDAEDGSTRELGSWSSYEFGLTARPGGLDLHLCSDDCPKGLVGPELALSVSVENAYAYMSNEGPETRSAEARVALDLQPASFWICWRDLLLLLLAIAILLFIIYGFFRPLRFPKPGRSSRHSFPSEYRADGPDVVEQLHRSMQSARKGAIRGFWWRDQELHLAKKFVVSTAKEASFSVLLRRGGKGDEKDERPTVPHAWILPHSGELHHCRYQQGWPLSRYKELWGRGELSAVPPGGAVLKSGDVYFYVEGGRPSLVLYFKR